MFKIGDVVVLKSTPGFSMTVSDVEGDNVYVKYYNEKEACFKVDRFHKDMLEKEDDSVLY